MSLTYPLVLLLVLLLIPMLWFKGRRQTALGHSHVEMSRGAHGSAFLSWLPNTLFALAFAALCIALARPVVPEVKVKQTIETRDFVVVCDISGSMFSSINGFGNAPPGAPTVNRIDVAQDAIKSFVGHRKGDRVALLVFDDDTYYHWPLTNDLRIIERKSQRLNKRSGGGTNFDGPSGWITGIGPLQATIDHLKEMGKAKTKVLVMVTDGEANISPNRFEELASQFEALGIRMYVLGVGESWVNGNSSTLDLRRFVERLGGTVIAVNDAEQMKRGFDTIDKMELSKVEIEKNTSFKDVYHWFLVAATAIFVLYLALASLLRENA